MVEGADSAPKNLQDWVEYIQTLHFRSIELTLDRITIVAERLGVQKIAKTVFTITGTNGKGSSVATLESLCAEHSLHYAAFTSPHLVHFNERIRLNGKKVGDEEIVDAFEKIEKARADISLTYFEFTTLAAFFIMANNEVDVAILEVGMGGRLDATNIVDGDFLIMTNIALDHTQWLGDTRELIGFEKAGLMRKNQYVFFGERDCPKSVQNQAKELGVHWFKYGVNWKISSENEKKWRLQCDDKTEWLLDNPVLKGRHQIRNSATCIYAFKKFLEQNDKQLEPQIVSSALKKQYLPGRLDARVIDGRNFIFEVGHNPAAIQAVVDYLDDRNIKELTVMLTFLDDKDAEAMITALKPYVKSWIGVKIEHERARTYESISGLLSDFDDVQVVNGIEKAKNTLLSAKNKRNDVLVIGSFFLVGDIMRALNLPVFE